MKIFRPYFAAWLLAAAALSSCERSYYSFQSKAPAYLGSVPTTAAPLAASVAQAPAARAVAPDAAVVAVASVPEHEAALATLPAATRGSVASSQVVAAAPAKVAKPSLGQRLALRSLAKQVTKAAARQQNAAEVTHTAATKGSLTVAIVGLVALLVGIIASSGFLIALGIILLVVGIVLFLLKLF